MGQRGDETSMKRKEGIHTNRMCRLNVDSAVKKGVDQIGKGDVFSSSARYMLGRGVKRKLNDCVDHALGLPYPQQRQHVLDLCLDKLQNCQCRPEPSLHRSVLLANTLRQIQLEMILEGTVPVPPAPPESSHAHSLTHRPIPEIPPFPSECPLRLSRPDSSPASPRKEQEEGHLSSAEEDLRSEDSLFGAFEITNSTSYLTDLALDDIFDDIDTSMYDTSDISVLAFPSVRGGPVSCPSGEDGAKPFSSCTSASALQLCLTDLSDLDHIMEILVQS